MCQTKPSTEPQNLHERFCQATHGIPCRTVHAIGGLFNLILGRAPKQGCCDGPGQKTRCDGHPPQP